MIFPRNTPIQNFIYKSVSVCVGICQTCKAIEQAPASQTLEVSEKQASPS